MALALTAAFALAFFLVPAAQAMAAGMLEIKLAGGGTGKVLSGTGEEGTILAGSPAMNCSGPPASGTCKNELSTLEGGFETEWLRAYPDPGSTFVSWTIEEGFAIGEGECRPDAVTGVEETHYCTPTPEFPGGNVLITVTFAKAQPLTLEKVNSGATTGEGTVVSNPTGIECGTACSKETAEFEEGTLVTLTANPASNSVFTSWTGCTKTIEGTGAKGRKCTVQMSKALTVKAKFTKVQAITANKDSGGNGFGTVSSSPGGIACGPTCSSATAVFTEGSTVTLKAAAVASTSVFAGWTSCEGTEEGNLCKVVASAAKSATAKFNLIPQFALTLTKSGFGTGTVSSSPAGISCGPTCPSAVAAYNTNKEVTLKAVAFTGSEFGGWSGSGCSGTGTCTVKMEAAKSVGAEFK